MNRIRPFVARTGWVTAVVALCALAFLVNLAAANWLGALTMACLGWLVIYGEAQHQRADDAEARLSQLISDRLAYYARNPRADWED